jgi:hypothetical protein
MSVAQPAVVGRRLAASPPLWVVVCVVAAIVSAVVLPTIPSYDPYSWIIWGREVSDPHLAFTVFDGPSWKPLPFAFTVVYGLFGGGAPTLWVITARTGGLLGLVAAWRVASRLSGGGRWGAVAGLLAVGAVVTTYDWGYDFLRGTSEPGLIGCTLWAIDRLWHGRRGQAYALLVAAALIRPEAWPFLIAGAGWLALRDRAFSTARGRLALLAGLLVVPAGWLIPPWLGSGEPLLPAHNARLYDGVLGSDPLRTELSRAIGLQLWPLLVTALACVAIGIVRGRRGWLAGLAAFAVAWWTIVIAMALGLGYPGLERFDLPAAAVVCVLGAAGFVELARLAGRWAAGGGVAGRRRGPFAAVAALCVLIGASVAARPAPFGDLALFEPEAALAVRTVAAMDRAVAAVGGARAVLPCPSSFVAVNHAAQPALAWDLHVGLQRVGTAMTAPGLDFVGPDNRATGIPAAIAPHLLGDRMVAAVGGWDVIALSDPDDRAADPCIGR